MFLSFTRREMARWHIDHGHKIPRNIGRCLYLGHQIEAKHILAHFSWVILDIQRTIDLGSPNLVATDQIKVFWPYSDWPCPPKISTGGLWISPIATKNNFSWTTAFNWYFEARWCALKSGCSFPRKGFKMWTEQVETLWCLGFSSELGLYMRTKQDEVFGDASPEKGFKISN